MPLLQVIGGPTPPSGRTLTTSTMLVATFSRPYADGQTLYPPVHVAQYDVPNNRWKPFGLSNGVPFFLPGGAPGHPRPPSCQIQEVQHYSGGHAPQTFLRDNVFILQTAPGQWNYGALQTPHLLQAKSYAVRINANGTPALIPNGWSVNHFETGGYQIIHMLNTSAYTAVANVTSSGVTTANIATVSIAEQSLTVRIKHITANSVAPQNNDFNVLVMME